MTNQGFSQGMPPQGSPSQAGRKTSPVWFAVIGVLVVALIAALVWVFAFRGDGGENVDPPTSPSVSQSEQDPSPEPSEEPSEDPSPEPSEDPSSEPQGNVDDEDAFPASVGDWKFNYNTIKPYYQHNDGRVIAVSPERIDKAGMEAERDQLKDVAVEYEELEDGFCRALEVPIQGGTVRTVACTVSPGQQPGRYYLLAAGEPEVTTFAEMKQLAEAIAAYKG